MTNPYASPTSASEDDHTYRGRFIATLLVIVCITYVMARHVSGIIPTLMICAAIFIALAFWVILSEYRRNGLVAWGIPPLTTTLRVHLVLGAAGLGYSVGYHLPIALGWH